MHPDISAYDNVVLPFVKTLLASTNTNYPILSFIDNIEAAPVQSDTILANWGDSVLKKWGYNDDATCPLDASSYSKTDLDSMNQFSEVNNGKYICLYGEDVVGNKVTLASSNPVNIGTVVDEIIPAQTPTVQSVITDSHHSSKDKPAPPRKIAVSKKVIKNGATLTQRGKKFSKSTIVKVYLSKYGGGYNAPISVKTSKTGSFIFKTKINKPKGTYSWYVVDTKTGKKSKNVYYKVK